MRAEPGCLFCGIVCGRVPAHVVWADDETVAFLDAAPAALGHTLVVPRPHVSDLWEAEPDQLAAVMRAAHAVAGLLRDRLRPDGLTVRQNNGAASGQRVAHLHLHLVPRWHGDGTIGWPWPPPADVDLPGVLAALRDHRDSAPENGRGPATGSAAGP